MAVTAYPLQPDIWPGTDPGNNQPVVQNDKGWDVNAVRLTGSRRTTAQGRANASMNDGKYQWPMFVHDVQIDLSLAGNTAQAKMTRDFYPHHFVMPSFVIQGQALDQADYGNLCEFLHQAQHLSVDQGKLLQFYLGARGLPVGNNEEQGAADPGKRGVYVNNNSGSNFIPNQMMRGVHQKILCQGYIGTMPRQHRKAMISPIYSFEFVVAEMLDGPYQDSLNDQPTETDWHVLLQDSSFLTIDHKLKWNNQWILKWITKNSENIFNSGSGTS